MSTASRTADRPLACIVMAGGKGTRMRSALPKVLHPIWGRPLLGWVIAAVREAGAERVVVVVPPDAAEAVAAVAGDAETVIQHDQLGTGDAVRCAMPPLEGFTGDVLIVSGDTPLLTAELLGGLVDAHVAEGAAATAATFQIDQPGSYGRVIRDAAGIRIVEAKDATPAELEVDEVNAGLYVFDADALRPALAGLTNDNAQGEYYLPDVVPAIAAAGGRASASLVASPPSPATGAASSADDASSAGGGATGARRAAAATSASDASSSHDASSYMAGAAVRASSRALRERAYVIVRHAGGGRAERCEGTNKGSAARCG